MEEGLARRPYLPALPHGFSHMLTDMEWGPTSASSLLLPPEHGRSSIGHSVCPVSESPTMWGLFMY